MVKFKKGSKRAKALGLYRLTWVSDMEMSMHLETSAPGRIRQYVQNIIPLKRKIIGGVKHYRVAR